MVWAAYCHAACSAACRFIIHGPSQRLMSTAATRVPETIQATGLSGRYCDLHGFRGETRDAPVCPHYKPENHRSGNFRVARMTRPVLPAGHFFIPGVAPVKLPTAPCRLRRLQLGSAPHIGLIHVIFRRNSITSFGSHRRRRPCRRIPSPAGFEASRGGAMRAPERLGTPPLCRGPRRMKRLNLGSRSPFCCPRCSGSLYCSQSTIRSIIVVRI